MARIDDLIAEIGDERVRRAVTSEVKRLREEKKFGLVFENHIPELSYLHGAVVRVRSNVVKRGARGAEVYRVVAIEGGEATIVRDVEGASESERCALSELTVVKRYGEAIYPALLPVESVTKNPSKPYHTIINSDNYHALQLLLYCYEGKFDLIYIDPPYNTGARDWKYNNAYVDSNDQWRHSKWLAMMKKRLVLAKRLLKPDIGVLIVTIDEHEVNHLGVLLEELYPEAFRQLVTIVINQKGVAQGRLSRAEEYAYFCFMKDAYIVPHADDLLSPERPDSKRSSEPRWERLLRGGTNSRREDRQKLFFPIYVDPERRTITEIGDPLPLLESPEASMANGGRSVAYPIRGDGSFGNWRVSPPTLRKLLAQGYVKLGGYDESRKTWTVLYLGEKARAEIEAGKIKITNRNEATNAVQVEYTEGQERQIKTVWHRPAHDSGNYGSSLLRSILGEGVSFPFPKSLYAVRDSLSAIVRNRKDALILDFFAGSGTTLHATALLNSEDGGNRRCILVTNNEVDEKTTKRLNREGFFAGDPEFEKHGICESVTLPRCKYVINGHRDDGQALPGKYLNGSERGLSTGFDENLAYFRLDFLDPDEVALGMKFESLLPLLWMMAGAQGELVISKDQKPFYIAPASPLAVLLREQYFSEFRAALLERPDVTHVFLVTDSEEAFREMSAGLGNDRQAFMLYKNYLDNFRHNIERTNR